MANTSDSTPVVLPHHRENQAQVAPPPSSQAHTSNDPESAGVSTNHNNHSKQTPQFGASRRGSLGSKLLSESQSGTAVGKLLAESHFPLNSQERPSVPAHTRRYYAGEPRADYVPPAGAKHSFKHEGQLPPHANTLGTRNDSMLTTNASVWNQETTFGRASAVNHARGGTFRANTNYSGYVGIASQSREHESTRVRTTTQPTGAGIPSGYMTVKEHIPLKWSMLRNDSTFFKVALRKMAQAHAEDSEQQAKDDIESRKMFVERLNDPSVPPSFVGKPPEELEALFKGIESYGQRRRTSSTTDWKELEREMQTRQQHHQAMTWQEYAVATKPSRLERGGNGNPSFDI